MSDAERINNIETRTNSLFNDLSNLRVDLSLSKQHIKDAIESRIDDLEDDLKEMVGDVFTSVNELKSMVESGKKDSDDMNKRLDVRISRLEKAGILMLGLIIGIANDNISNLTEFISKIIGMAF